MPSPDKDSPTLVEAWAFQPLLILTLKKVFGYAMRQGWIGTGVALKSKLYNRRHPSGHIGNCYQLTSRFNPDAGFFILVEQLARHIYLDVGVEANITLESGNLGILVDYSLNPYSYYSGNSGTKRVNLVLKYQDGSMGKRLILNRQENYTRVAMDFTTLFGTLHEEGVHIPHIQQPKIDEILQEIHSSSQLVTALNPKTAGHLARGLTVGNLTQVLSRQPLDQAVATITQVITG